jgi:predicted ester cyclase
VLKAFPDIHFTIEDMVAERDKVAAFVTMSGTHEGKFGRIPPTGKRVSVQQVHWFRIANGKVAEHWVIRDDLSTMRQLGVVSDPEQSEQSSST